VLKGKGVTVFDCDREAFRKRVAPQTEAFLTAHPDAKPWWTSSRRHRRDAGDPSKRLTFGHCLEPDDDGLPKGNVTR